MFEIAFKMFDLNGDGDVEYAEFDRVLYKCAKNVCLILETVVKSITNYQHFPLEAYCTFDRSALPNVHGKHQKFYLGKVGMVGRVDYVVMCCCVLGEGCGEVPDQHWHASQGPCCHWQHP